MSEPDIPFWGEDFPNCTCGHSAFDHRGSSEYSPELTKLTLRLHECRQCECAGFTIEVKNPRAAFKIEGFK